jgi:hypothetical protein
VLRATGSNKSIAAIGSLTTEGLRQAKFSFFLKRCQLFSFVKQCNQQKRKEIYMTTMNSFRSKILLSVAVAFALGHSSACGQYVDALTITGLSGGGHYTLSSYTWGPTPTASGLSNTLTWIANTDNSDQDLISAAQNGTVFSSAEITSSLQGTVGVDILMSSVTVQSVVIQDTSGSSSPQKVVTLKFTSVTYTFQPLLPNGQKNGPPFTVTQSFKK